MFFITTVLNSVSTIAVESSDVASAAAKDDLSNDQDSVEEDYPKTNKNERSSVQDIIAKCNDGTDTQIITTGDIAASVLLELQSQQVRPESQDDLKNDFVLLGSMEDHLKESKKEDNAMSTQSILSCTEKFNDIINLLKNCMDGSKGIPTANNDIHLAL